MGKELREIGEIRERKSVLRNCNGTTWRCQTTLLMAYMKIDYSKSIEPPAPFIVLLDGPALTLEILE